MLKKMINKYLKKHYGIELKEYKVRHDADAINIEIVCTAQAPVEHINVDVKIVS